MEEDGKALRNFPPSSSLDSRARRADTQGERNYVSRTPLLLPHPTPGVRVRAARRINDWPLPLSVSQLI